MKYIDADELYKKIDERMAKFAELEKETEPDDMDLSIFYQGKRKMCSEVINLISSLQQEQPEVDLEKDAVSYCYDNGINISPRQAKGIASHFYELGQRTKYQQDREEFAKLKSKEWQSGYDEGYAEGYAEGFNTRNEK